MPGRAEAMTGPYFDDLRTGQVFAAAPAMTLTSGLATVHQSILGDRLRLPLDAELSAAVTGSTAPLAHPGLVCDVAIGQSTLVTQQVKANLFYRGLMFYRFPVIGDTLFTRTEVVGLKKNSAKPDRAPTGLVALRMTTIDQADRVRARTTRITPTTYRKSVPIWPRRRRLSTSGTATCSVSASPDRISTPIWRARSCGAVPMWSAVHQNWPA
jgi:acyl dehydratase